MGNWKDLPLDILHQVLLIVRGNFMNDYSVGQKSVAQCQLVCQAWKRPAQYVLYREIYLNRHPSSLSYSLSLSPLRRKLVQRLYFSQRLLTVDPSQKIVQSILVYCQNLRHLACHPDLQKEMATIVLISSMHLRKIESVQAIDGIDTADDLSYILLASINFEKSLKHLCLRTDCSTTMEDHHIKDYELLLEKLDSYTSLTSLGFHTSIPFHMNQVEYAIDACPSLKVLQLHNLSFLPQSPRAWPYQFNMNDTVESIIATDQCLGVRVTSFLMNKFSQLKSMALKINTKDHFELTKINWKKLVSYLSTLSQYDIQFETVDYIGLVNTYTTAILQANNPKKRRIFIDAKIPDNSIDLVSKDPTSVRMMGDSLTDDIILTLRHATHIQALGSILVDTFLTYHPNDISLKYVSPFSLATTASRSSRFHTWWKSAIRSHNIGSWTLFDSTVLNTRHIQDVNITLEGLLLLDYDSYMSRPKDVRNNAIGDLTFRYSTIHVKAFPVISAPLRKVHRLKLYLCDLMIEGGNRGQLAIHFPYTKVQTMVLYLSSLQESIETGLHPELQSAIAPTGQYVLKIETDSQSYYSIRCRSKKKTQSPLMLLTEDCLQNGRPFIIWIKCRSLEHIIIQDDLGVVLDTGRDNF